MEQGTPPSVLVPAEPTGWFDSIKEYLSPATLMEKIRANKSTLIDIGVYAAFGFLTGFLLKKYSTHFIVLVLFIAVLIIFQQLNVIVFAINWDKARELFGIQMAVTGDSTLTTLWEMIKSNMVITISYAIGFLIGLKFS